MYAHERSLVNRMKGRPFALVGVNNDTKARAVQAIRNNKLSWPSFWDGEGLGPIFRAWQINAFPTLYLIDHRGIIRQGWQGSPGAQTLDALIQKYVKDAEAAGGK